MRLEELEREYKLNEEKIAALRETLDSLPEGSGTGISADGSVAQMIAELVVRNVSTRPTSPPSKARCRRCMLPCRRRRRT